MTLQAGWTRMKKTGPNAQGRRQEIPDGPAHAVPDGSDQALCGASIVYTGHPWPNVMGSRCRDCMRNAAAQPTPLGE